MKRQIFKRIAWAFLAIFVLIQFIRPQKNNGIAESDKDYTHYVQVPDNVRSLLKTSCYDCHSNKTNYPWYAEVAPASWWLANHIKEGKSELNFSDFSQYTRRRIKSKLSSTADQVKKREMPLKSYLVIHLKARLGDNQIRLIIEWVDSSKAGLDRKAR